MKKVTLIEESLYAETFTKRLGVPNRLITNDRNCKFSKEVLHNFLLCLFATNYSEMEISMYYFIVNQSGGSGNAKHTWNIVRNLIGEKGIHYKAYLTRYEKHASILAEKISMLNDEDIRLIVVGGDGTINEVINGIKDYNKVKLGVIPTGSGNDFARGLNLPHNTKEALERILASDGKFCIDLGQVTFHNGQKHLFGISSGIGLDAIVCKKVEGSLLKKLLNKLHLGNIAYVLMTVQTVFSMKKYSVNICIHQDKLNTEQQMRFSDLIFLAGMNFPAEGGGVPMAPAAKANDGLLSICAVNGIPKWRAFIMLLYLMKGKHQGRDGINIFNASSLTITSEIPMVLHTDGEYLGEVTELKMEILPAMLGVLI